MKIIVQWLPDVCEKTLYDLNEKDFMIDIDTYGYFLDEVFWKGIKDFVKKKYKAKFKDMENVDGAKAVESLHDNQEIIVKYWKKYNKIRDEFYLYKGAIYSYTFIGFWNVGHDIQICKYDLSDLLNILNNLKKERAFYKKFGKNKN